MIEFEKKHQNVVFVGTILVYLTEFYLYLINFISDLFFVCVLLTMIVLNFMYLLAITKLAISKLPFVFSIIFSVLIFIYEMPLILIDNYQYLVTIPSAPEELIKGSGIFILSIQTLQVATNGPVEDEQTVRESYNNNHIRFFDIIQVDNHMLYRSKNKHIFEALGLSQNEFEQMSENVAVNTKTRNESLDEFLARENSSGSSAGLALVLSSFYEKGVFQNYRLIGVTGAIDKNGKVTEVGGIKEKIQIANENGFSYIILPIANLSEAKEAKKILNLQVGIKGVRDVDEAIEFIKELNKN